MLNLISNPWIPVRRTSGPDIIRPDQIAEPDVLFPDWPRPDLNLACLELLVGLVYLAAPPVDADDWRNRAADPRALRAAMAPLAPAFNLLGDGPRFMQDYEAIEGSEKLPDVLFIDCSGDITAKKNADVMVKRDRYTTIPVGLGAMALYTLQAFAPAGAPGWMTSIRGGGPLVTLVRPPETGLWPLVWANVPCGNALGVDELAELPWMRPTVKGGKHGVPTVPPFDFNLYPFHPEVFFGLPRRIRLISEGTEIVGVKQARNGTDYQQWIHPLSPYYQKGPEKIAVKTRTGGFGYRNWRGVILEATDGTRPECLIRFLRDRPGENAHLLIGGWAMKSGQATPLDFLWSEQPVFPLTPDGEALAGRLVEAAELAGSVLAAALREAIDVNAGNRGRAELFARTQAAFEALVAGIAAGQVGDVRADWRNTLRRTALTLFDAEVLPGLADRDAGLRASAVTARRNLVHAFAGTTPTGRKMFTALGMELPKRRKETA